MHSCHKSVTLAWWSWSCWSNQSLTCQVGLAVCAKLPCLCFSPGVGPLVGWGKLLLKTPFPWHVTIYCNNLLHARDKGSSAKTATIDTDTPRKTLPSEWISLSILGPRGHMTCTKSWYRWSWYQKITMLNKWRPYHCLAWNSILQNKGRIQAAVLQERFKE